MSDKSQASSVEHHSQPETRSPLGWVSDARYSLHGLSKLHLHCRQPGPKLSPSIDDLVEPQTEAIDGTDMTTAGCKYTISEPASLDGRGKGKGESLLGALAAMVPT